MKDLASRFTHHPASEDRAGMHDMIRSDIHKVASMLNIILPECREKSIAVERLEEAMFWANAALARPHA